jgi:flagellar protein FlbT
MALKINLKPHEKLLLGSAVITNGNAKCSLYVENNVTILREKDILKEKDATSPCKRIYFVVQMMYVDQENLVEYHKLYWKLVRDVVGAAPSVLPYIDKISDSIVVGQYYQALKFSRKLINYEQEVLLRNERDTDEHVQKSSDGHPDRS